MSFSATMMNRLFTAIIFLALIFIPASLEAQEVVKHDLKVELRPTEHSLVVEDTITVPGKRLPELRFLLHKGLAPSSSTPGVTIVRESEETGPIPLEVYRVTLPPGLQTFVLRYGGRIHHPVAPYGKEYARGFRRTPGTISNEGVYLSGSSLWYPRFDEGWVTFNLQVELPWEWDAVSQGERTVHAREIDLTRVRWESPEPQDEIYLVAARFTEYDRPAGRIEAMVFLRSPDEKLAGKYLDATVQYVDMYEKLIGPYPYGKFALVENFWETGFGMPSFTLMGSKIIRFPFILHSSYPHEILHNWWGNSVFSAYGKGNWVEGLTAYLSDHLIKEQQGRGASYRQMSLQKYADYVSSGKDFPLTEFTSRHSSSTEAVGYGKSLMFFHMLRLHVGDELFMRGLQDFYRENKFRYASFEDIKRSLERVSGERLEVDFDQWIRWTGAPEIKVSDARGRTQEGRNYLLTALLEQEQPGDAYVLRIPFAVTVEERDQAIQDFVVMEGKRQELKIRLPGRPLRLDIDPQYDMFRRLDRRETPPALTQAFGAKKVLIILPFSSGEAFLKAYRALARSWAQSGPDAVEMRLDTEVDELPSDRAVAIFGEENRFLPQLRLALSGYDVEIKQKAVRMGKTEIPMKNHTVVLTARHPDNRDLAFTWVATDVVEAMPGLSRKLPHYHKYSYLGFEGDEPANVAKGRWPVLDSPMTVFVPGENGTISKVEMGRLATREPLATLPPVFSEERMLETIRFLSKDELKGRGLGTTELDRSAEYIAAKFQEAGLKPGGDSENSYFQTWEGQGTEPGRKVAMRNVIGFIPGLKPQMHNQSVVVGAHYDHLGLGRLDVRQEHRGKIHPGADDNASGVAVLLELARVLGKGLKPDRNVVFVAFTGEEAGKMGSTYYVSNQKRFPPEHCMGMLNLDTVGRLENKKLLVLGAGSAKEWVHLFRGAGFVSGVEVETVSEELDSSDQKSFQEAGVPAVQLFSGPHLDYHRPGDTADKIDPKGLVKVTLVAKEALVYLAGREEPLTSMLKTGKSGGKVAGPSPKRERKVSLGTVPDFAFKGEGYRLSGVVPGSPAETAGLVEGDVIVQIGKDAVRSLRDLSHILKSMKPGDQISITFMRNGKKETVEAELEAR
jgi:hypothetical protein